MTISYETLDGQIRRFTSAITFEERTAEGVSTATGRAKEHERLYRTKAGAWVLHHWSDYEGVSDVYREIDARAAVEWLTRGSYHDELATLARDDEALAAAISSAVDTGPARRSTEANASASIELRVTPAQKSAIQAKAKAQGLTVKALILRAVLEEE